MRKITLIPGDGVGPEVISAAKECIEATGVKIKWEEIQAGAEVMEKSGTPLPEEVIESKWHFYDVGTDLAIEPPSRN